MSPTGKNIIKYSITFAIAVLIFWYVLSKIDIQDMMGKILSADFRWVGLALAASILSHVSRAYRWNILMEPLGHKPSLRNTFLAVMVGYFANLVAPRMGEVSRCVVLTKIEDVPFNSSFGSVVAERAFDLICLLCLLGIAFFIEIDKFGEFFQQYLSPGASKYYLISGGLFVVIIGAIIFYNFRTVLLQNPYVKKLADFLFGVWQGVTSIGKIKRRGLFLLHTFIIWFLYFMMSYLVFFAMPETSSLGIRAGLLILVVGGLGMSAPVQGGIGVFHKLVAAALFLFYDIPENDGIAYAFVVHTSQTLIIILVGGLCLLFSMFISKKKLKLAKKQPLICEN
ncbi:MAG: lysylphosphatidylglycerol synthase transmembrane domain-containing protein [Cytophagaceae bacterium]